MIPLNLMDPNENFMFEDIECLGKHMIFTTFRVDRSTVPKGIYIYDIMHDENAYACKIAPYVLVNHLGTVLSTEKVSFPSVDSQHIYLGRNDFCYIGSGTTLEKYLEEHKNGKSGNDKNNS